MRQASVVPIYGIAAVWLIFGLAEPLNRVGRFVLCAAISLGVYLVLRLVFPAKEVTAPPDTGDRERDAAITKGLQQVQKIQQLQGQITDAQVQLQLNRLGELAGKIFAQVEKHPEQMDRITTFMDYYLPTTLKLMQTYLELQQTGVEGSHIGTSMQQIEKMLDLVVSAFQKQLDALFESTGMDIAAEIQVMQQMLEANGLTGQNKFWEEEP